MNDTAKQQVKDALLARAKEQLEASQTNVGSEHDAAQLDQDSPLDTGDESLSDEAGDLTGIFEEVTSRQEDEISQLEALDVSPRSDVGPGAVVEFGGAHYVVGVIADPFEVAGVTYEGISTDSPVYAAIEGKRAGDTFEVAGKEQTLDSVS
ncbi:transcription elongation GreA/GreB family factor [Knoellia remsis]|uniref:Transcription elongation GreA/GreB family factor n=1 Tax=Knoellia remsis TaxID=407159 RepID=A0A2T0U654_9MICO|nr:hypothetical protein [Knoellia remsis]PRY53403.1 transcription elongation GreA/GreB family factor [Knoellia remsis]